MAKILVRRATLADAAGILQIYGYYVENTAVTFEYDVPSLDAFRQRIAKTLHKYPYLVACIDGRIVGYAYAGAFVGRAAYDWSAEVSIYVDKDRKGSSIGRKLYGALERALSEMGVLNLYACIAYPEKEDEYLTADSANFHAHMGYRMVGQFSKCGNKFGRWYNMIWMEKMLGDHAENPDKIVSYDQKDNG